MNTVFLLLIRTSQSIYPKMKSIADFHSVPEHAHIDMEAHDRLYLRVLAELVVHFLGAVHGDGLPRW